MMLLSFNTEQVIVQAEDITLSFEINDSRMVSTGTWSMVHYVALIFPWTFRTVTHCIANTFRAACRSKCQIIVAIALVEPWSFLIVFDMWMGNDFAACGNHVLVEFDVIKYRITPVHICLTVIVNPNSWVNVVPMFLLPYECMTERILERSVRSIANKDTDTITMNRTIHVVLTVTINNLFCPCAVGFVNPFEVLERSNSTVVSPVHHIGRGIEEPVKHLETVCIVLVMSGVEIYRTIMYHRCRVGGVLGLDNWVLGK